uniref:CUB domain-containing protein n=2 Tax=Biomphalaria glabrata TaxID=6526 RepID=A0A2C9KWQ8_BIOGL
MLTCKDLMRMLLSAVTFSTMLASMTATKFPMTIYADELCYHGVFLVDGDVIIMVSKNPTLPANTRCSIQMQAGTAKSLVASIRSYHMDSSYTHSMDCQYESIQLETANNTKMLGPLGYCKSEKPAGQYILGETGYFSYVAGPYSPLSTPFVELLVSEVYIKNDSQGCSNGFFNCDRQNICVDNQLTCNGYNDCGNDRDEDINCKLTAGVIAGIVVGGVIFILIIVILGALHYRHRKMRLGYIQH